MKQITKVLFVFGVTLGLWCILSLAYHHPTLPSPFSVLMNIGVEIQKDLPINILYSAFRVLISTFFALALGVPLGILLGYHQKWNRILSPFVYFSYPMPKMALLPILMLLFGLGEVSKVLMIFLIIFFPVVLDIAAGVSAMDKEIFQVMKSFGLSGRQICSKVVLPGLVPTVFSTLKITTGIALSVLFFAENYGTTHGLGYYIMNSWQKMDYVDLYTGVLVLSLLGFALFCLFDYLERKLTPWR